MSKITNLDEMRPHAVVKTKDGNAHIIPMSVFENVISGKLKITAMDDWEKIMIAILTDFVSGKV